MKTPDEIKNGLDNPIHVHFHISDIEPRLTPLALHDLEFLHTDALAYIQQLEAANAELLTTVKQLQKERDATLKQLQGHCWCCKKGKPLREGSSMMICPHFGTLGRIAGILSGCPEWEWNEGKEFEHEQ